MASANQRIYNAPDVAQHYASLAYLSVCEKLLFETYIQPGMAILDVGVGGGRTTPYLSSMASRYVGIDYAEEMIRGCRKKLPGLDFRVVHADELTCFADASFDAVVMAFNTIDYLLPDSKRMLSISECRRILRSGGVLIFSSHNPRSAIVRPAWNADRVAKTAGTLFRGSAFWARVFEASLSAAMPVYAFTRCLIQSSIKISQKIRTKAFWKGSGLWLDPSHGGLVTHTWTPSRCIQEVTAAGFQITKYLGDDFPRASGEFVTDWYYYVFKKI